MPGLEQNYASVAWPDGTYNLGRPFDVEVVTLEGVQEIAVVSYGYPQSSLVIPPDGSKVLITHGVKPNGIKEFFGYVNHHERDTEQGSSTLRIYCVGTSLPLNNTNPSSWTNVTASYIAKVVAGRYGLRPVLTQTSEIIAHWAQGNESDFKMMLRLAERAGCRFWVSNGSLYFLDPSTLLTQVAKPITNLVLNGNTSDTLLKIATVTGSMAPANGAPMVHDTYGIKQVSTRSSVIGTVLKASSKRRTSLLNLEPGAFHNTIGYQTESLSEGQHIANSALNLGNWTTALAYIASDVAIRVGDVIQTGGSKCPPEHLGVWVVIGVDEKYGVLPTIGATRTSVLTLTRNQPDGHAFLNPFGAFQGRAPITGCVSHPGNDLWVATETGAVYV